jgi:hypothetical protein
MPLEIQTITRNFDFVTELTRLVVDLDTIMEEFLVCPPVKDLVICGTRIINDEFVLRSGCFGCGSLGLVNKVEPTENGTQQSETNCTDHGWLVKRRVCLCCKPS